MRSHRFQGAKRRLINSYLSRPRDARIRRTLRRVGGIVTRLEARPRGAWFDLATNGETALLLALGRVSPATTILDIGANQGDWYRAARRAFPDARILCVEVAPPLWPGLERLLANDPDANLVRVGLGADDAEVPLHWYPSNPALSTTVPFPHAQPSDRIVVRVQGMPSFLADHDIDSVDVAKVDIEGAELPVVLGLESLMARGRVGLVQFEYGKANILTRSLLYDYAELARRTHYRLGRLHADGVDFTPYTLDHEDFQPRNMILCRPDLASAVRVFSPV